jgi:hypothetical protein
MCHLVSVAVVVIVGSDTSRRRHWRCYSNKHSISATKAHYFSHKSTQGDPEPNLVGDWVVHESWPVIQHSASRMWACLPSWLLILVQAIVVVHDKPDECLL